VHGFNHTFESAALDAARLSDGIRFRGETLAFCWPSKAGLFDYVYDRESAMWSRDAFRKRARHRHYGSENNTCISSRTAWGQCWRWNHCASCMRIVATLCWNVPVPLSLPHPISIWTFSPPRSSASAPSPARSRSSRLPTIGLLALSRRLAGGVARVGAAEKARLEKLGLRVIDASEKGWGLINHDLFLTNKEVRQVVRRAIAGDEV